MADITQKLDSEQQKQIQKEIKIVEQQIIVNQKAGNTSQVDSLKKRLLELNADFQQLNIELKQQETEQIDRDFGGVIPLLNNEQTFLLDYFVHNYDKLKLKKELKNIVVLKEDSPKFLNRIALPEQFEKLLEIRPIDKARLVPSVRLFKVFHQYDKELAHEEFKFNNFTSLSDLDLVSDSIFRGDGAGIKNIDIELNGKNQRLNYLVNVKLTLIFQDLNILWQKKDSYEGSKIRYADLLSAPNKKDGKFYRIRMLLGYNGFEDTTLNTTSFILTRLLLNLNYVKHSLELRENGMCQVVVEYAGDLEKILLDPDCSNILGLSDQEKQQEEKNKKKIEELDTFLKKKEDENVLDGTEDFFDYFFKFEKLQFIKKFVEEQKQNELERQEQQDLRGDFQKRVEELQKRMETIPVYGVGITFDELKEYKQFLKAPEIIKPSVLLKEPAIIKNGIDLGNIRNVVGTTAIMNQIVTTDQSTIAQISQYTQEQILTTKNVPFVLLGDLFDSLMDKVCEQIKNVHQRNFQLIFGHTVFYTPGTNNLVEVNLAKIPISLNKLNNFFAEKLFGKGIVVYTFLNFFEDLFKDFFRSMLQEYSQKKRTKSDPNKKQFPTSLEVNYLQLYKKGDNDYSLITETNRENGDAIFIYGSLKPSYATWNYSEHILARIPHFFVAGADRGIAKNIKFSSTANPKTKVALYKLNEGGLVERNSLDNTQFGGNLTPEVFSVEISTVGFPYFYNGQIIFVDTSALGLENPEIAEQIMAGGYYMIHKTEHTITPSKFESKIVANILWDNRSKSAAREDSGYKVISEQELMSNGGLNGINKPTREAKTFGNWIDDVYGEP